MATNISKILVKYLKGSTLDLVKCYLCLGDGFYFSSTYIEGLRTKQIFNYVLGGRGGWKENKDRTKRS